MEVSRSSWDVAVYCPATDDNIRTHKPEPADTHGFLTLVLKVQNRVASPAKVLLVYEGGYEDTWLARYLDKVAPDIEVVIIDPANL